MQFRVRLFWVKMISGNHFPGCNEKWNFPEIHFLLTNIYSFDPDCILHSYFQFKSFPERERERKESPDRREREEEERADERQLVGQSCPLSIAIASALVDWRAARTSDEHARRSHPSTIAIVDRATRRTIAPISPPISLLPRDLIFSSAARSQFDRIRLIFLLGFVSSVNECGIDSLFACLQLRKCVENWSCKAFSVKMFEWTKHWN